MADERSGETAGRIAVFLDAHHVMSLATCGPDGAHATNLFYARDEFSLVWVSDPQTRHSLALARNARVSATVAPDCRDFHDICGVQISGTAHRIDETAARDCARTLLETRYPFLQRLADHPAVERTYQAAEVYRLVADRIVMVDNTRGFGHKDVLELEPCPALGSHPSR
jgi:uncharacterized protein YhbP (UPF0306 family)